MNTTRMHTVVMANERDGFLEEAVDHVPESDLAAYVADAETRWQTVTVAPEGTN